MVDEEETVYVLADWPSPQVGELVSALCERGIEFALEGNELVVANRHSSEVDALITQLDGALPHSASPLPPPLPPVGSHPQVSDRPGSSRRKALKDEVRPWVIASAAAIALGSLMPWASVTTAFGSISVAGTEGDGVLTLAAGIIAAVLGALRKRFGLLIVLVLTVAIAGYDVINVSRQVDEVSTEFARASVGWGLWLVLAASIAGLILALTGGKAAVGTPSPFALPPPPPPPPPPGSAGS